MLVWLDSIELFAPSPLDPALARQLKDSVSETLGKWPRTDPPAAPAPSPAEGKVAAAATPVTRKASRRAPAQPKSPRVKAKAAPAAAAPRRRRQG